MIQVSSITRRWLSFIVVAWTILIIMIIPARGRPRRAGFPSLLLLRVQAAALLLRHDHSIFMRSFSSSSTRHRPKRIIVGLEAVDRRSALLDGVRFVSSMTTVMQRVVSAPLPAFGADNASTSSTSSFFIDSDPTQSTKTRSVLQCRLDDSILTQNPSFDPTTIYTLSSSTLPSGSLEVNLNNNASSNSFSYSDSSYPNLLEGTWNVTQTLIRVQAPLGIDFLNPSNRERAQKSFREAQTQLNQPIAFQLRYVSVPQKYMNGDGRVVVENRVFNTVNRLNAFAGRRVVAFADYADTTNRDVLFSQLPLPSSSPPPLPLFPPNVGIGNKKSQSPIMGKNNDTVIIRFKGPASQKTIVTRRLIEVETCHSRPLEDDEKRSNDRKDSIKSTSTATATIVRASENQRSIFSLTNANPAPPIVTDLEVLTEFQFQSSPPPLLSPPPIPSRRQQQQRVVGRLRIASYLTPLDALYFEARNRAVSLQDYTLDMIRLSPPPPP